ncbi:Arginyl-tRNA synthetase [Pseudomonas syringae pv. actinidiae]|uniref:Arginyl-tRNA synthetase n=1 Tax=Pseudomonas syringae pv. actinidiae TaxID=103796 RepID=A0AAN4Q2L5_PSESF|nr:Arginyl-tRNA synthetase [Pseudomonas syringae pv. actinidiae]
MIRSQSVNFRVIRTSAPKRVKWAEANGKAKGLNGTGG